MKIICVAGGSYKSFYINYFNKINKCDLLIFNYGIIYNYDVKEELLGNAIVTKELLSLSQKLNCVVVAGVYQLIGNKKIKSIIVADGDKIHVTTTKNGAQISIKNNTFIVGDENTNYFKKNKIILSNKKIIPNPNHCASKKIYIFCHNFGVNYVVNKALKQSFNKLTKIIIK